MSINVAVQFARTMGKGLSCALAEWEHTLMALEQLQTDGAPVGVN